MAEDGGGVRQQEFVAREMCQKRSARKHRKVTRFLCLFGCGPELRGWVWWINGKVPAWPSKALAILR